MIGDWILLIIFGGLLGMIGQGARAVVGLKKVHDDSSLKKESFSSNFKSSELVISLVIGFIAGSLGVFTLVDTSAADWATTISKDDKMKSIVPTLIAIGYAGTDFIEGFMKKHLPTTTTSNSPKNTSEAEASEPPPVG